MAQEAETPRRPTPRVFALFSVSFCGRSRVDSKCHSSVTHVDDFDPSAVPATLPPFVCKLCTKAEGLKGGAASHGWRRVISFGHVPPEVTGTGPNQINCSKFFFLLSRKRQVVGAWLVSYIPTISYKHILKKKN